MIRLAVLLACLLASLSAQAQSWQVYSFKDDGFAVQLPAAPKVSAGSFHFGSSLLPARVYAVATPDAVYEVTVADAFRLSKEQAIDEAVKTFSAKGTVTANVEERIDRAFGRSMLVAGADGSRSVIMIFFVYGKLYMLEGRALPPNPAKASAKTVRFQQSLDLIVLGAEQFRPENQPGGRRPEPPGGNGSGPAGPPQEAFEACRDKPAGAEVKVQTPRGLLDATCVDGPFGRAARPKGFPAAPPGRPPR